MINKIKNKSKLLVLVGMFSFSCGNIDNRANKDSEENEIIASLETKENKKSDFEIKKSIMEPKGGDYSTTLRFKNDTGGKLEINKLKLYIKNDELKIDLQKRSSFGEISGIDYWLVKAKVEKNNQQIYDLPNCGFHINNKLRFKNDKEKFKSFSKLSNRKVLKDNETLILEMNSDISIDLIGLKLTYVIEYKGKILKEFKIKYPSS